VWIGTHGIFTWIIIKQNRLNQIFSDIQAVIVIYSNIIFVFYIIANQ